MPTGTMTGRNRRNGTPPTAAERAERKEAGKAKAQAAVERLDAAVANIIESDDSFREYLRISGKLHGYSWGNRLLIAIQRPDTSMVAGFHRWRELGRPVAKGAKGIQILAPMVVKQKVGEDLAGYSTHGGTVADDGTLSKVIGFRVAYVFAAEDTTGPPMAIPHPVGSEDDSAESAALADRLESTAARFGCKVDVRHGSDALGDGTDGRPAGWANLQEHSIVVNGDLPAAERFKVLTHELAHCIADHKANDDTRRDCEAVAEGAAFVVAAHYGMDTTAYAAPYVAGWAQDVARLRRLLERITKVAAEIIDAADVIGGCAFCGWDGIADGGCEHCR